jgi:hypothetical protein
MGRRKRPSTLAASNDLDSLESEIDSLESDKKTGLGTIDPTLYENNAAPKLKVIIVVSDNEEQIADANIVKHLLRRDRIRSSIHKVGTKSLEGVINTTEELLASSIKSACCTLILDAGLFKEVALRTWLTGRFTVSWVNGKTTQYLDHWANAAISRPSHLSTKIREIKAKYTKELIHDIKKSAFTFAEF